MQVMLDNKRVQIATGIFIKDTDWDDTKQLVKSKIEGSDIKNAKIESMI